MPAETIPQLIFDAIANTPRPDMISVRDDAGVYTDIPSEEIGRRIRALRLALESLGLGPGDRVAILSENRLEWILSDLAVLCAGASDVPIYPTLGQDDIAYILNDCEPGIIFVSTPDQARKIHAVRDRIPSLKDVVCFDRSDLPDMMTFDRLMEIGENLLEKIPGDGLPPCGPSGKDDIATILYTSGTTGRPKGVILTHGNIVSNIRQAVQAISLYTSDRVLSFLPLSHALERTCGYYAMLANGIGMAIAGNPDTVGADMMAIRPTIMICVPRFLEKVFDRINTAAMGGSPIKRNIFIWAKKVVHDLRLVERAGKKPSAWLNFQLAIVDKLVFAKLRARTGGRIRFFVSGGAPLAPHINQFFNTAGMTCLEGYGLTETSPILTANLFGAQRVSSVGKPFPETEIRIADDGEILARGPQVTPGYFKNDEATREALSDDGWFRTGDIGHIDGDGFLFITDRKKDLIVTAGGKNIAPQPIENAFAKNKFISNSVVIGDHRPYMIALLVPNFENLEKWARERGITWEGHDDLERHPEVQAKYRRALEYVNRKLPKYSTVKKFALLRNEFTLESGELTPTLKVKRRVIQRKYHDVIEDLYSGS